MRGAGLIQATCPVSGEVATLETVRAPSGGVRPGCLLVARSVPRPEGRLTLLGAAPAVEADAERDFEALLAELAAGPEEPELLWRHRGGRLASAAWSWIEERDHTLDGELVQDVHVVYALPDLRRALDALDADTEFDRLRAQDDEETAVWHWVATGPTQPTITPSPEPGVRWELCEEDRADPPARARIEVGLYDHDLWLFAPTVRRLLDAEAELTHRLSGLLGERAERYIDHPSIVRRWQRERFERSIRLLPPRLRRPAGEPRTRAAAA